MKYGKRSIALLLALLMLFSLSTVGFAAGIRGPQLGDNPIPTGEAKPSKARVLLAEGDKADFAQKKNDATLAKANGMVYLKDYEPEGQLGTGGYCGPAQVESMLNMLGGSLLSKNQYVIQLSCGGLLSLLFNTGTDAQSRYNYLNNNQSKYTYKLAVRKTVNGDGSFSNGSLTESKMKDYAYNSIINNRVPLALAIYFTSASSGWLPYAAGTVSGGHAVTIYGINEEKTKFLIGDSNPDGVTTWNNVLSDTPFTKTATSKYTVSESALWRDITSLTY